MKRMNESPRNQWKGWLIAAVISVISGLALLNVSIEFILLILILFSGLLPFIAKDPKSKTFFRKNKYLLAIFIMISSSVLIVLTSSQIQRKNFHTGNVFREQFTPSQSEGFIFGDNSIPDEYIQVPEEFNFYRLRTEEFGHTSIQIWIELYDIEIESMIGTMWYYYDNNIGNAIMYNESIEFEISESDGDTFAFGNLTFISFQSSFQTINYLFKILAKPSDSRGFEQINLKITFETNLDVVDYSYIESRNLPIEGGFLGDTLEITEGLGFTPTPVLLIAGFVIILSYILILALSFVWQKFDIAAYIFILYTIICIVLLFWYVTWGMENPTEIIGNPIFELDWSVLAVNLNPVKDFLIAIIAIQQWVFSIGIILVVMLLITKTFTSVFNPIPGEITRIKLQLSELMDKVGGS